MKTRKLIKTAILLLMGTGITTNLYANNENYFPNSVLTTQYETWQEEPKDDWLSLGGYSVETQDTTLNTRSYVSPLAGSRVHQTPPEFTWPSMAEPTDTNVTYELEIVYPDTTVYSTVTDKTWIEGIPGFLSANEEQPYWWRVRALRDGQAITEWSACRSFYVVPSVLYAAPTTVEALYQAAENKARPRSFPNEAALLVLREKFLEGNPPFKREWGDLEWEVKDYLLQNVILETPADFAAIWDKDYLLHAVIAGRIANEPTYIQWAKTNLLNMASWEADDPSVACDWEDSGHSCRAMTVFMAILYDWLYHDLTPEERTTVKDAILAKLERGTDGISTGMDHYTTNLRDYPMESWLAKTMQQMIIVTTLMAGEDPGFNTRFKSHMPFFLAKGDVWGAADGSMNNSMHYGAINLEDIVSSFYFVNTVTGYDLSMKQFYNSTPYYWLYFQPPVRADLIPNDNEATVWAQGAFGDGSENPLIAHYLRRYLHGVVSHFYQGQQKFAPSIRWYANKLNAGLTARPIQWLWLLNPVEYNESTDVLASYYTSSAYFPAGGQVAIHSDLEDLNRTSIYFRSSPYGTANHNHADQNSFVVHKAGIPLLIDAGYYNGIDYKSEYHLNWYSQTKAHNAITYDGGQGQKWNARSAIGTIKKYYFDTYYGDLTEVVADAQPAYGDALKEATRTLMYSKYGIMLIHDKVSSDISRTWEWNLHATHKMETSKDNTALDDNEIKITNAGEMVCVSMYSLSPVTFNQTNETGTATPETISQWHGRFSTEARGKSNEFLAIIRVGCGTKPTVVPTVSGWEVSFHPRTFEIKDGVVSTTPRHTS